jgi:hypothetical protein
MLKRVLDSKSLEHGFEIRQFARTRIEPPTKLREHLLGTEKVTQKIGEMLAAILGFDEKRRNRGCGERLLDGGAQRCLKRDGDLRSREQAADRQGGSSDEVGRQLSGDFHGDRGGETGAQEFHSLDSSQCETKRGGSMLHRHSRFLEAVD